MLPDPAGRWLPHLEDHVVEPATSSLLGGSIFISVSFEHGTTGLLDLRTECPRFGPRDETRTTTRKVTVPTV